MPRPTVSTRPDPRTRACDPRRRRLLIGGPSLLLGPAVRVGPALRMGPAVLGAPALVQPAAAQGVELATLATVVSEGALLLEFAVRLDLPRGVEDALQRGVPVYFIAEAQLLRSRWYWLDESVARVSRQWRIAYQPLTGAWRVGLGGLHQNFGSMAEALAAASRGSGWKLAEAAQLEPRANFRVEFSYRLDTTQLPGPLQFGLGGPGEWALGVQRSLRLE